MNIAYYLSGALITILVTVGYEYFRVGRFELNPTVIFDLSFRAIFATIGFIIADLLFSRKKKSQ